MKKLFKIMSPNWENSNSGTNAQLVHEYSLFLK